MRLAASRPGYGLSLQGAGAGILYLTAYAAFRLYGVLPEAPAVVLLIAVSALTVWLAVRNDSQPLAGLAIGGGFLAPVLVGNDGGPVLLFGYFALLNAAIFSLAWSKAWPVLNAVGFAFTFVLGALWGHEFYGPEHYAAVQPFLALFFVFYVAIAILYARRGPLAARDPVDGLLVFGVPLVGFALQAALVREFEYGAAWSALALAIVYALLFLVLRRRGEPGFPLLSRAFLVLAVVFATIAIPFALENRWTAALWAVEGAGVYWIGVRQSARLARAFALVVELGAGVVFVASGVGGTDDPLFANAFFAGALLIAVSGLVTTWIADRSGSAIARAERSLVPLLFAWGVLWWLAAGGVELVRQLPHADRVHAVLAWVVTGVALALALARPLSWPRLAGAGIALLPAMVVAARGDFDLARTTLDNYGWIVWPCAWLVHWRALRAAEALRPAATDAAPGRADTGTMLRSVHAVSAVAVVVQLAWEASEWTGRFTAHYTAWTPCAAALPAIVYLWLVVRFRDSARWPLSVQQPAYAVLAGMPLAGLLTAWFFAVNVLSPGDVSPLPYLPLVNPLDLTLALALWSAAAWAAQFAAVSERARLRWIGVALFVALNGVVLRTAHHWGDVPWRLASAAGVETAAGGPHAGVDADGAHRDGRGDEAASATAVDVRRGAARRRGGQAVRRRSFRAVRIAARRRVPRGRHSAARDRIPVAAAAGRADRCAARRRAVPDLIHGRGRGAGAAASYARLDFVSRRTSLIRGAPCPATRSARCFASHPSVNRMVRRSVASSTAARPDWRSRRATSSASSTGAARARRGT